MDRALRQGYAAGKRFNALLNGVKPLVFHHRRRNTDTGLRIEQIPFCEMNERVFRATKRGRCLGNLIQNRMETHARPRQVLEHLGYGFMTILKLPQFSDQLSRQGIVTLRLAP
jgi:hypothetical protein